MIDSMKDVWICLCIGVVTAIVIHIVGYMLARDYKKNMKPIPNVEGTILEQCEEISLANPKNGGVGYTLDDYLYCCVIGGVGENASRRNITVVNTKGEVVTKQVAFVNVIADGKNTLAISNGSVKTEQGDIIMNEKIATLHISEGMKQVPSDELDKVAWNVQKANESKR